MLADGDITKRHYILYHTRIKDIKRYAKLQIRKRMFREAIIALLIGENKNTRMPEEIAKIAKQKKKKWLQEKM